MNPASPQSSAFLPPVGYRQDNGKCFAQTRRNAMPDCTHRIAPARLKSDITGRAAALLVDQIRGTLSSLTALTVALMVEKQFDRFSTGGYIAVRIEMGS
jgi:hypothetical protein